MTWYPISFIPPQTVDVNGAPYSGAVLKAYAAGTSTPILMATDSTGATTAGTFTLNSYGYPAQAGAVIIPHVEENYKLALYPNQAAADADSGAVYTYDDVQIVPSAEATLAAGMVESPEDTTPDLFADFIATYDTSASASKRVKFQAFLGQIFPDTTLYGLKLSYNATDTINDLDITAGACVSDDGTAIIKLSALTKQVDAAWAAGTNQGSLDTGTIADGVYYVWAIHNPTTGVNDILTSLSSSAPTMPSGYTKKCKIGVVDRIATFILGVGYVRQPVNDGPVMLMRKVANASAQLDFRSVITSEFDTYDFILDSMIPGTDDQRLFMRTSTDNGATYDTGADYSTTNKRSLSGSSIVSAVDSFTSGSAIVVGDATATNGFGSASGECFGGTITLQNPRNTTLRKIVRFDVAGIAAGGFFIHFNGGGTRNANTDIDAVRFLMASGNLAAGTIELWGRKNT